VCASESKLLSGCPMIASVDRPLEWSSGDKVQAKPSLPEGSYNAE
jgi:hypothetical protein